MSRMPVQSGYWLLRGHRFEPCADPAADLPSLVCLHTHSCYSTENLASLNWVVQRPYMRPLKGVLRRAFGLPAAADVDYRNLCYSPPFRPIDLWRMEVAASDALGGGRLLFAITDHDEVAGGVELRQQLPEHASSLALGEELSIWFNGLVFHLGITGLPPDRIADIHVHLQTDARRGHLDAVFERLASLGGLTVLNHPLLHWQGGTAGATPVLELLRRFGWAIDALEFNGMRSRSENDAVVELSTRVGKPLVGGGDSHLLMPSAAFSASDAATYEDFIQDVKSGRTRVVVTRQYFLPLRWKMFLRVLSFIAQYRTIATYKQQPVGAMLSGRRILLDPVGHVARATLGLARRTGALA